MSRKSKVVNITADDIAKVEGDILKTLELDREFDESAQTVEEITALSKYSEKAVREKVLRAYKEGRLERVLKHGPSGRVVFAYRGVSK